MIRSLRCIAFTNTPRAHVPTSFRALRVEKSSFCGNNSFLRGHSSVSSSTGLSFLSTTRGRSPLQQIDAQSLTAIPNVFSRRLASTTPSSAYDEFVEDDIDAEVARIQAEAKEEIKKKNNSDTSSEEHQQPRITNPSNFWRQLLDPSKKPGEIDLREPDKYYKNKLSFKQTYGDIQLVNPLLDIDEFPSQLKGSAHDMFVNGEVSTAFTVGPENEFPKDLNGPEIAFAGRSNVGKSSIINALVAGRKIAYTSSTPGHTKRINFYSLHNKACNNFLFMVDMPGYGYAEASLEVVKEWNENVRRYIQYRQTLKRIVLLIDARHGVKDIDENFVQMCSRFGVPIQIVLTKCDKLKGKQLYQVVERTYKFIENNPVCYPHLIPTSAHTLEGIPELRNFLYASSGMYEIELALEEEREMAKIKRRLANKGINVDLPNTTTGESTSPDSRPPLQVSKSEEQQAQQQEQQQQQQEQQQQQQQQQEEEDWQQQQQFRIPDAPNQTAPYARDPSQLTVDMDEIKRNKRNQRQQQRKQQDKQEDGDNNSSNSNSNSNNNNKRDAKNNNNRRDDNRRNDGGGGGGKRTNNKDKGKNSNNKPLSHPTPPNALPPKKQIIFGLD